ncbi:MAG: thiol-disulfide oxidoreductase DCC family protein [Bacteroidales bacterium]|nr:MAG: thiol-disulfide oxidoreductase DCC family protein [Bacteroidales bacterium]
MASLLLLSGKGLPVKIILFDGMCNLCNFSIRFIIKRDKRKLFKFASIQSEVGQSLLKQFNIQTENADSVVYIKDDRCFARSAAVLNILKDLGSVWKTFYVFIVIPKFLRDFIYNVIAKIRYRVFGKREKCMIPTDDIRNRFLK